MASSAIDLASRKNEIRQQAHANRRDQPDKDGVSVPIVEAFMRQPEYEAATTVMFYVDVRDEVRTRFALEAVITSEKRIVIPFCVDGELELFLLEDMSELELGMYKILEPTAEQREVPGKRVEVAELDLIMVPGVAFDAQGARAGHGKGYYDKLLQHARPDAPLVALAFDCQIFPEVPVQSHDIYMDKVITESQILVGRGR